MVTLSNGRTNFSFNASLNDFTFDGNCSLKNGKVFEMNASVRLASPEEGQDPYIGNINFNKGMDVNSNVNVSANAKEDYLADVLDCILTIVEEIEQSN